MLHMLADPVQDCLHCFCVAEGCRVRPTGLFPVKRTSCYWLCLSYFVRCTSPFPTHVCTSMLLFARVYHCVYVHSAVFPCTIQSDSFSFFQVVAPMIPLIILLFLLNAEVSYFLLHQVSSNTCSDTNSGNGTSI